MYLWTSGDGLYVSGIELVPMRWFKKKNKPCMKCRLREMDEQDAKARRKAEGAPDFDNMEVEELRKKATRSHDLSMYLLAPMGGGVKNCSMCHGKLYFGTMGKVYEGRFWAKRTNSDTLWWANLCQECQPKVKDFINENKTDEATGVREWYEDPMGG